MRQVTIRELRANLSAELNNLPFVITRKGEIVAEVGVHLNVKKTESGVHHIEAVKEKLTEIIKKKKGTDISETTIATGVGFFKPCPKPGRNPTKYKIL